MLERGITLTFDQVRAVREHFGTPCYVYDSSRLTEAATKSLSLPSPFGLTVRYAMKANPSYGVLQLFRDLGLHIDASSDHEIERALRAGFAPSAIQLTSQMPSQRLQSHLDRGVLFNACSVHQLEAFGRIASGSAVSVRINPGSGSGGTNRTTTGGPASSFGIWHEQLDTIRRIAKDTKVTIERLHTHIGSGSDPESWKNAAQQTLRMALQFPDVHTVNLGGGFKVGRVPEETTVDLANVGHHLYEQLSAFQRLHGRALHLEIEPGTYLVARAGYIIATCVDTVDTGANGHLFAKLDAGMPEILRPSLYGAQHPIQVLASDEREERDVVFAGI